MFRRFAAVSSALVVSTLALVAYANLAKVGTADLQFQATGPLGMKIEGGSQALTVADDGTELKLTADLSQLKTGSDTRDGHLQEQLAVKSAVLTVAKSKLKLPADNESKEGSAVGTFKLNGVAHNGFSFTYKVKRTGSDYHVQALATIKLSDHNMKVCKIGDSVCVEDNVNIKAKFKLRE